MLIEQGYQVNAARDGHEATLLFPEFDPDIVVLDMRMPKMSGPNACAVIRQSSDVPIIMFTSSNDAVEVKEAILKGASDFVLKSTGVAELTDRISFHLDKRQVKNNGANHSDVRKTIPATPPTKLTTTTRIVDPDEQSRATIKAVLTRLNQNAVEANTVAEAIKAYKQHHPDIGVTEWKLPDMDGFKLLSQLKRKRGSTKLLKLMIASRLSPEAHRKAQFVGVSNFLDKPLNGAKVEVLVADCVRKAMHSLKRRSGIVA